MIKVWAERCVKGHENGLLETHSGTSKMANLLGQQCQVSGQDSPGVGLAETYICRANKSHADCKMSRPAIAPQGRRDGVIVGLNPQKSTTQCQFRTI